MKNVAQAVPQLDKISIQQQVVEQLVQVPWGHNRVIISKCKDVTEALYYVNNTIENNWSRNVLTHQKFLLELGSGFAFVGRQNVLQVGERDFFLDLLFYHTKLHCYVVVELKTGEFEPEYAGKLNFYLKAVDEQLRGD